MGDLRIIAGQRARKKLSDQGLVPDLVRQVVGASGGPKWLVLKGLDSVVFGDFLPAARHHIPLTGSSAGAWRMAAAADPDPATRIECFARVYAGSRFTPDQSPDEITRASYDLLAEIFPDEAIAHILANSARPLRIVTARGRGLAGGRRPLGEGLGLMLAGLANTLSRQALSAHYQRVVFHTGPPPEAIGDGFETVSVPLTAANFRDALMASGSIPFVMAAITDIAGAGPGVYRDGGLIDYHFGHLPDAGDGIILYPHFYPYLVPGWFDKKLHRRVTADRLSDAVMLVPDDDFVAGLPHGRIPDRRDFARMEQAERLHFWQTVVKSSERLGAAFSRLAGAENHGHLMDRLEPVAD
ncbi:patatin-like phospholipase family protein [Yunchengibacter salinarum]|uniref:patatin-like phospholipase family protein n=1 Tax=Yunchengibacter salinarum TaxID=3133399 RepID=UPI0035B5C998